MEVRPEKGRKEDGCAEVLPMSAPGDLGSPLCSFFKAEHDK